MSRTVVGSSLLLIACFLCSEAAIRSGFGVPKTTTCPDGYYGYGCRHHCHCRVKDDCGREESCEGRCVDGWSGPQCQSQNVAFRMPAKVRTRDPQLSARSAVDGDGSTCVTSEPDSPGWLRVDLQAMTNVYYVTLTTGEGVYCMHYVTLTTDGASPRGWQLFVTEYSDFYWSTPCATVRSDRSHVPMSCDSPSTGRYVTVLNTQGPITVCEIQVHVCATFTFGAECGETCQCADVSEVCHPLTGHCTSGCRPGLRGRDCQHECRGSYGSNCGTPCGQCRHGAVCHPLSGLCPGHCQPGWTGDHCNTTCPRGRYGLVCTKACGGCRDDDPCDPATGLCPNGCQAGLHGPRCDQVCRAGRHGPDCQFPCGQCVDEASTCNPVTGICPRGCGPGWEGLFCAQECLPHNYGHNCVHHCGHCLTSCHSHSGHCDHNGCSAGRWGTLCDQDCKRGFYGINCINPCGACAKQWCDVISGHCPESLCRPGWEGAACDQSCRPGLYGVNCSLECGACEGRDQCHPVSGLCPGACDKGFHGDSCQHKTTFTETTTSASSIALIVSILCVVLIAMIVLCLCLALKWRRD